MAKGSCTVYIVLTVLSSIGSGGGIERYLEAMDKTHLASQGLSSWNQRPGDLQSNYKDRVLRCYAYVVDGVGTCARANTMYQLVDLNRKAERILPNLVADCANIHPASQVDPKATVSAE